MFVYQIKYLKCTFVFWLSVCECVSGFEKNNIQGYLHFHALLCLTSNLLQQILARRHSIITE